ncbi:MAG: DUF3822 family protein [Rhizobacter sp.]|nr:DUF3822 family protein [Ferruginibacter sp.]
MKTAFKILPEFSAEKAYHLLAEAGRDGISLVWYSKEPLKIEGLFIYQSLKNTTDLTLAEDLQKILAGENLPHYHSCRICYNFKESLLVPAEFYKEQNSSGLLDCMYGTMPGSRYFSETINEIDATNIYRVPGEVHEALTNRFFAAQIIHSNSCLVPYTRQKDLYCIVYNSYVKAILYIEETPRLVQLYDYNTPSDVAYHLLNICAQHGLSASAITLTLSGFIDEQSNLYAELYRYFLNISMDEIPEGMEVSDEIRSHPDHFFSFLIALAKCAS